MFNKLCLKFKDDYFFIWISLLNLFSFVIVNVLFFYYLSFVEFSVLRKKKILLYLSILFEYSLIIVFIFLNTYCLVYNDEIFENLNFRVKIFLENIGDFFFFCFFIFYYYVSFVRSDEGRNFDHF